MRKRTQAYAIYWRLPVIRLACAMLVGVVAGQLAGCSRDDGSGSRAAVFHFGGHKPVAPSQAGGSLNDMVAAVSASNVGPDVGLKFSLVARPQVGQPLDLDVAVVPGSPAPDSVSAQFQVTDGMDIVEGAQLPQVDRPAEGEPVRHTVKLLPKRDGIFAVTAIVSVSSANDTTTRTFSIPVITGEAPPVPAASASSKGS